MKTLNIKLPIRTLEKYATVKPENVNRVFREYLGEHSALNEKGEYIKYEYDRELDTGLKTNYSLKIDDLLHSDLKLASLQQHINMNEYAGQVIYHEVNKRTE